MKEQLMNALNIAETANLTMSSREIAELTGKRHDHVMTDIRNMLADLGLTSTEFQDTHRNEQNGHNVKLRKRIIDRWRNWRRKTRTCSARVCHTLNIDVKGN